LVSMAECGCITYGNIDRSCLISFCSPVRS